MGSTVAGILLCLLAGLCNGSVKRSWAHAFPSSPHVSHTALHTSSQVPYGSTKSGSGAGKLMEVSDVVCVFGAVCVRTSLTHLFS